MHTCVICRFEVPIDDAVLPTASGRCVCLRCYAREVGDARPVSKALRRQVVAVLEAGGVA